MMEKISDSVYWCTLLATPIFTHALPVHSKFNLNLRGHKLLPTSRLFALSAPLICLYCSNLMTCSATLAQASSFWILVLLKYVCQFHQMSSSRPTSSLCQLIFKSLTGDELQEKSSGSKLINSTNLCSQNM